MPIRITIIVEENPESVIRLMVNQEEADPLTPREARDANILMGAIDSALKVACKDAEQSFQFASDSSTITQAQADGVANRILRNLEGVKPQDRDQDQNNEPPAAGDKG